MGTSTSFIWLMITSNSHIYYFSIGYCRSMGGSVFSISICVAVDLFSICLIVCHCITRIMFLEYHILHSWYFALHYRCLCRFQLGCSWRDSLQCTARRSTLQLTRYLLSNHAYDLFKSFLELSNLKYHNMLFSFQVTQTVTIRSQQFSCCYSRLPIYSIIWDLCALSFCYVFILSLLWSA